MIRSQLCVRQDNPNGIFYFSPEDFPGLKAESYEFQSQLGHSLKGYFYHYDDPIPGRLLVFDLGMGWVSWATEDFHSCEKMTIMTCCLLQS